MTWKERLENNFTIFVLSLLVAGFGAGLGTYKFFSEAPHGPSWTDEAKKENWIPKNECPAYPVSITETLKSDNEHLKTSIAQCKNDVSERDNSLSQARTETNMLKARAEASEKTDREHVAQLNTLHAQLDKINTEISLCRTAIKSERCAQCTELAKRIQSYSGSPFSEKENADLYKLYRELQCNTICR